VIFVQVDTVATRYLQKMKYCFCNIWYKGNNSVMK